MKSNSWVRRYLICLLWWNRKCNDRIEFSLNVFTEISEFSDKIYYVSKRLFEPATSLWCNWIANTATARHRWQRGSLNWTQFMLQWFIRFPEFAGFTEFLIHLGKTLILHVTRPRILTCQVASLFRTLFMILTNNLCGTHETWFIPTQENGLSLLSWYVNKVHQFLLLTNWEADPLLRHDYVTRVSEREVRFNWFNHT